MGPREVARLAQNLVGGYYAHAAALAVARDPRAQELAPPRLPGNVVPIGFVPRKDGSSHAFHFMHYLELPTTDEELAAQFNLVWLSGALLQLGDALSQKKYFDHAPELELIYHIRNGVAHGNRFNIHGTGVTRLQKYPAHNHRSIVPGDKRDLFEVTTALNGSPVLFDFMGPADVLDLLLSASNHLAGIAEGYPGRPDISSLHSP